MQGIFDRFRSAGTELAPANVSEGWDAREEWRRWEPPCNFISGESHYAAALQSLAGEPRPGGYLLAARVRLARDAANPYDKNAFRAEIDGRHVGHLARDIASQIARPLDRVGCQGFEVCGLLRGGSDSAPNLGVHVWLSRRLSPGPELLQRDSAGQVSWPPTEEEGRTPKGYLRGRHYSDYTETVKALRREGRSAEAEGLLLELLDVVEEEASSKSRGVAPWCYEQLAILYSKQKDPEREIAVLERFACQPHAPGASPSRLLERLEKKKSAAGRG